MATQRLFQDMLNDYLVNDMLKEEMIERDFILKNCQKDNSWKGGEIPVPFKAAGASSVKMGGLTLENDISSDKFVRGKISDYKEAWGSMFFNHRDIMDHSGRVNEDSFLKILPDSIDDFLDYMKMVVSVQLGTGPEFAKAALAGTLAAGIKVTNIDRFVLDQKVDLADTSGPTTGTYYVTAIDVNTEVIVLSATRGGAAADLSAFDTSTKFYTDGASTTYFQSLKDSLLSLSNGGSANLHGVAKTSAPYLQAVNIPGASWTSANILDKLFDGFTTVRRKAKGKADTILCSYLVGGSIMKKIEGNYQGQFKPEITDKKATAFGWDEISIRTVKGNLKIVMIQEWSDTEILYVDMKSFTFRSNGFFQKHKNPDGNEFYTVRSGTGYKYVVDICLFGELEMTKPGSNGIVYGIDPTNFAI